MKKTLTKAIASLQIKKLTLAILLLVMFSIVISGMISKKNLKETMSLMSAMGVMSSKTHMLYCEEKYDSLVLIELVVDFDNRTIMTHNQYYNMAINPKNNMPYFTADDV